MSDFPGLEMLLQEDEGLLDSDHYDLSGVFGESLDPFIQSEDQIRSKRFKNEKFNELLLLNEYPQPMQNSKALETIDLRLIHENSQVSHFSSKRENKRKREEGCGFAPRPYPVLSDTSWSPNFNLQSPYLPGSISAAGVSNEYEIVWMSKLMVSLDKLRSCIFRSQQSRKLLMDFRKHAL